MGIANLFRPKYRHSDVRVRTEAIKALTADDAAILIQIARTDRDIGVRRLAIEKIDKANVLAEIAAEETERSLRKFAGERAAELWTSIACGDDDDRAGEALGGIIKLGDQHALVEVAVNATLPALRKRAFGELRDPRALAELAKGDAPQDLRLAAVARIDDGDVLRAIAIDTTLKEVGLAAVDKLDDVDRLEHVAQKAKNKAVRQRARKIVAEIQSQEAERSKKPGLPDDVKRRRAEKSQLIRELEGLADTFDFDKVTVTVKAAEEAWQKLSATADDGDDRFTKATERFWKRKEAYGQQTRSADELRAIEREAQREKEAAARDREARIPDDIATKPEPVIDEAKRAELEAEAQARREERDKRKAEDDAKRAEEQAARDARRQEDAERGVAIAASLAAMCDDMEKLASDSKDGRAIDRLLQQAARSFEQLGKAPQADRDTLSDRYTAARGKLVVRASELREAEDWQRFANVPKAEALIATAKAMLAEEPSQDLGNRLRQLQALWKEVGPMPQRRSKELWEQFKTGCDQVYDKVKGFRAVESEKFSEVAKVKEALIAEAEALADSTDWGATASALKELQARWKQSGHMPRKQGDELWKRFRAACDKFFERRKPQLDAAREEEAQNLAAKQALITRAQKVADGAPGDGGWGKAIGEIKDLQHQWKEIGFVPRRDADAVYRAFRAACDALFIKRDEARDSEANAHRDEIDAVKGEIADVLAGGDDVVARAIAIRAKARELDSRELSKSIEQMIRHVISAHADAIKGTELDPSALRARREKLIGKVSELLPKQTAVTAESAPADIAAQLKQAMRSNAFGDLRFSGRDPIEVIDELRTQWIETGPILDDEDQAQATRFDELTKRVLDAAGAEARADRDDDRGERDDRDDRSRRRRRDERGVDDSGRRRDRRPANVPIVSTPQRDPAAPIVVASAPDTAAAAIAEVSAKLAVAASTASAAVAASTPMPRLAGSPTDTPPTGLAIPRTAHDLETAPAATPAFRPSTAAASAVAIPAPAAPSNPVAIPKTFQDVKTEPGGWAPASTVTPAIPAIPAPPAAIPQATHDVATAPAKIPFEPLPPPPLPVAQAPEPERAKPLSTAPPMAEIDDGWDMGDDDPTAVPDEVQAAAAADEAMERPNPPSSSEMAGDGGTGGDGIDEPGWD